MKYVPASQYSEEQLVKAHNEIFQDYEGVSELILEQFQAINLQRGVNYEYSIAAVDYNKIVGLILNAIREYNGTITSYDCGTGVVPEFRGKGIAKHMFIEVKKTLLLLNCHIYLLEVIQTNKKALNLYKNQGFKIIREFECMIAKRSDFEPKLSAIQSQNLQFSIYSTSDYPWDSILKFQNFFPSWQNSNMSMRFSPRYKVLNIAQDSRLLGYMVFNPLSGEITQIGAEDMDFLGGIMIKYLVSQNAGVKQVYFINIDSKNKSLIDLLSELGFSTFFKQYEMLLEF